jgi:hypothetical protein
LIPFRARPALRRPPSGDLAGPVHGKRGNSLLDRLDPADGRRHPKAGTTCVTRGNGVANGR